MAKGVFQDMVKVKREREKEKETKLPFKVISSPPPELSSPEKEIEKVKPRRKNKKGSRYGIWFLAVIAIIFLFFAVSLLFVEAQITVNPEIQEVSLEQSFSGVKSGSTGAVSFDLMVLSGEEKKSVSGGEMKEVSEKAFGKVRIFNNFSSATQVLDIDTRLEGTNGKIYKTEKRVVVPGKQSDGTPGSLEVGVYAAEAGEEYNSEPLDFTIVGFKGTPKYEKFYARSVGEITGGSKGSRPDLSEEAEKKNLTELETTLREKLLERAFNQVPSGFILWEDAVFVEMNKESLEAQPETNTLEIKLQGTLYGFLFKEKEISEEIIFETLPEYDKTEAYISNLKELEFLLLDKENITLGNVNSIKNINFNLSGNPKIVYKLDTSALSAELLGKKKSDFENILTHYPHIKSAELSLRPVWKKSFPDKKEKIEIVVNYP